MSKGAVRGPIGAVSGLTTSTQIRRYHKGAGAGLYRGRCGEPRLCVGWGAGALDVGAVGHGPALFSSAPWRPTSVARARCLAWGQASRGLYALEAYPVISKTESHNEKNKLGKNRALLGDKRLIDDEVQMEQISIKRADLTGAAGKSRNKCDSGRKPRPRS